MARKYWNKQLCAEEALKYKTKTDFNRGSVGAYTHARKRIRDASIYTSKKYRSSFILERYFFVSICPAASHGTCLAVFLVAVLPLC